MLTQINLVNKGITKSKEEKIKELNELVAKAYPEPPKKGAYRGCYWDQASRDNYVTSLIFCGENTFGFHDSIVEGLKRKIFDDAMSKVVAYDGKGREILYADKGPVKDVLRRLAEIKETLTWAGDNLEVTCE